jgi:DNA repair protein RecN (Recombination protein N)
VLVEIRIDSLGAIKAANAEFDRGLTVLTGETGTGKTMVVTGLHLLGGARADTTRVRSGSDKAVVEGRFTTTELDDADTAVIDVMTTAASSHCVRSAARGHHGPILAVAASRRNH